MNQNMKSTAIDSLIKRYSKEERDNLSGDKGMAFDKSGHIFKQICLINLEEKYGPFILQSKQLLGMVFR